MSTDARRHHYLSKVYLKRFTQLQEKDSQLVAINLPNLTTFSPNIINIAVEKDFNRLVVNDTENDANVLEHWLGDTFEPAVETAIVNIISTEQFKGSDKDVILQLMAFFAVRNPSRRKWRNGIVDHISKINLSFFAEAEIGTVLNGIKITQEIKDAASKTDDVSIQFHQNHQILFELQEVMTVFALLSKRSWRLIKAPDHIDFIACDRPVYLEWENPEEHKLPAGFGLKDTLIMFPLTKKLILWYFRRSGCPRNAYFLLR